MADEQMSTSTATGIPLFDPKVPPIPPAFSEFFTSYTHIKSDDLPTHLLALRDRAYATVRYPCLGRWRFLHLDLAAHPCYNDIVALLTTDLHNNNQHQSSSTTSSTSTRTTFLDLGCCLGQDLRKLIWDVSTATGGPPTGTKALNSNMFGADLKPEFIDIGYELFADEATLPHSQFIAPADVFDDAADAPLAGLDGKVSILNCISVFHLFDWDGQVKLARRVLRLLNREGVPGSITAPTATGTTTTPPAATTGGEGGEKKLTLDKQALVVGAQMADVNAGEYTRMTSNAKRYAHNEESWERLWKEAVATPEWEGVIKGVRVWSELLVPSEFAVRFGQVSETAASRGEVSEQIRARITKRIEQGFRMQVFSVWVDFH